MKSTPYSSGEELCSGARAPFIFSALARALLRDPEHGAALDAAHALGLQPDGMHGDRACFMVDVGGGRIALADWLAREGGGSAGAARFSPRIRRLNREPSSPFDFTMKEFQEKALPIYSGTLHSWPQHDEVKAAFPHWPEARQIDFVHTYLDYFSSSASAADAPTVDWVRSRRRFRSLFVAEPGSSTPPAGGQTPVESSERLAEALRFAGLQMIDLCLARVAERRVLTPDLARRYPDKRERLLQTIRLEPRKAEKFVNLGVADEIVHLYMSEECFPSAPRPERLADPEQPAHLGISQALSSLGEPPSRGVEIEMAERGLELHAQWENYGRGRPEYEANRSPEFEAALNRLRRAAEDYLSLAW